MELFRAEYGREPGAALSRAAEARPPAPVRAARAAGKQAARARLETGRSAISAGSFDPGVRSLARAAAEANACGAHELEAESWLALGTALVHSARGRDEEGANALLRATALAEEHGLGDLAAALARETRWVAFEPWPESWLAEADLADGELPAGRERFEHAWALASELGDPCWESAAGQGLGRIACLDGQVPSGLRLLEEARPRAASFPDAYVWVEAHALAELASAAVAAEHRRVRDWVDDLASLAARTGMRELAVRAYLLRAHLGDRSALNPAAILVAEVENPALCARIHGLSAAIAD